MRKSHRMWFARCLRARQQHDSVPANRSLWEEKRPQQAFCASTRRTGSQLRSCFHARGYPPQSL